MMISNAFGVLLTTTLLVTISCSTPVEDLSKNSGGSDCNTDAYCITTKGIKLTVNTQTFCCKVGDSLFYTSPASNSPKTFGVEKSSFKCTCRKATPKDFDSVKKFPLGGRNIFKKLDSIIPRVGNGDLLANLLQK